MPNATKALSARKQWQQTSETKSVVYNNLCITGPDRASFWATFGVILVPGIHFLARVFAATTTTHTSLPCGLHTAWGLRTEHRR